MTTNKKALALITTLLLAAASMYAQTAKGFWVEQPYTGLVRYGGTIDIPLYAVFEDGSEKPVDWKTAQVSGFDSRKSGTQTIKVTAYNNSITLGIFVTSAPGEAQMIPVIPAGKSVRIAGDGSLTGAFFDGRTVVLNAYALSSYELSYATWYEVYQWAIAAARGANKYAFANKGLEGGTYDGASNAKREGAPPVDKARPVTMIMWRDAVVWCNAYSEKEGLTPVYTDVSGNVLRDSTKRTVDMARMDRKKNGYRLPTDCEWELAARGGDPAAPDWNYRYPGTNSINHLGWYVDFPALRYAAAGKAGQGSGVQLSGQLASTRQGLFDMGGNVMEFCWDADNGFPGGSPVPFDGTTETDPTGPAGLYRTIRNGGWNRGACYYYSKGTIAPMVRSSDVGFRVARSL